jgi:hypothetical protein
MIIVAGDSFVHGSELQGSRFGSSPYSFARLLAPESDCVAWPGFGNDAIARTTIERCEQGDVTGVLVSWTFPGRYEFRFAFDTGQRKTPWHTITPWTIMDTDLIEQEFVNANDKVLEKQRETNSREKANGIAAFADVFYRNVGATEYWEIYSSFKEIVYLQNYLKLKSIPYMFTCADTYMFYPNTAIDATLKSLFGQIDFSKWYFFPEGAEWETTTPRGFYQWAVENKYPMGTTHPLEPAHRDAANLMQEKFNELVTNLIQ